MCEKCKHKSLLLICKHSTKVSQICIISKELEFLILFYGNFVMTFAPGWGGEGYSHTLRIRVCAAQRGRDFEAPDLEWGIHLRGVF